MKKRTRTQFELIILAAEEGLYSADNKLVFDTTKLNTKFSRSKRVMTSENRLFRMFCKQQRIVQIPAIGEDGQPVVENGVAQMVTLPPVNLASEFVVVDMSKCEDMSVITTLLRDGFHLKTVDAKGKEKVIHFMLAERSPSQIRQKKGVFTSLNVEKIRKEVTFNMEIASEEIISQVRAHAGLSLSSSMELSGKYTFDVMPDYSIERTHDVESYDYKKQRLVRNRNYTGKFEPLDGQGTIRIVPAIRAAQELHLISIPERKYAIEVYEACGDIKLALCDIEFARIWARIPSAFQIRMAQNKGLLVVHEHDKETTDCRGNNYRDGGMGNKDAKIMRFWKKHRKESKHFYDFNSDILFTDSMWKRNFDPKRIDDVKLEIVLFQKPRRTNRTFMGHQYWQATTGINVKNFAAAEARKIDETVLSNAAEAIAFLNMMQGDETDEQFEDRMDNSAAAGTKVQKIIEVLHENPDMIEEKWVQQGLRKMKEKFIEDMATGRIPVEGSNPYIITAVECQFGRQSKLEKKEYYYNGRVDRYAIFRSPLIHKSEASVINTVDVEDYHGLYRDLLIFNPYDDTLSRAGGADTDGDRMAMTNNPTIVQGVLNNHVMVKNEDGVEELQPLPMLYDPGKKADPIEFSKDALFQFDFVTISNDKPSIGEITNMALSWKDIAQNPDKLKAIGFTAQQVDNIVKLLRFEQGYSIDFPKTGFFPEFPKYVETNKSPDWKAWSRGAAAAGIKGAEVYKSQSQLGMLFRAIMGEDGTGKKDGYLYNFKRVETKADQSRKYRDFFFEMTDAADKNETERIRPIVKALYKAYNNEFSLLRNMKLDEEQEKEARMHIFTKYEQAIMSIDADVQSIAAAAYKVAYSKSKNKAVSFPWITCYEGLLLNIAASSGKKIKLKKIELEGHIDNVPDELKFYRKEAKGEGYIARAQVKNGTYKVYRRNGAIYLAFSHKGLEKAKNANVARPENKHLPFVMVGFKNNGHTTQQVIDILKAAGGIVTAKRVHDTGSQKEQRIGIFATVDGELTRICSADKDAKDIIGSFLPCTFEIKNLDTFQPTFISAKREKEEEVKRFAADAVYVDAIEADADDQDDAEASHDEYGYINDGYGYADDYGYGDEPQGDVVVMDFDDVDLEDEESIEDLNEDMLKQQLHIVHASAELSDKRITVSLTNAKGKTLTVLVRKSKEKGIVITNEGLSDKAYANIAGTDYETLIVMIAERLVEEIKQQRAV